MACDVGRHRVFARQRRYIYVRPGNSTAQAFIRIKPPYWLEEPSTTDCQPFKKVFVYAKVTVTNYAINRDSPYATHTPGDYTVTHPVHFKAI